MASGDDSDIGHAQTQTPVAGVPVVAAATPPKTDTLSDDIERPESDKLQRAVARARVAEKLFAKKQEVKVGRYHLLEMVGAGGMGVVWGAWDPELDRRVAIKLVKAEMQAARDRILIEGQALAKLSHPNVVPVYDVGVVDEQVYLVMEFVRGKNLRSYCRLPRTVREIVTLYRAAGEGLSAAHRVGLIHRDFKPDNAMIGDDDRVRVLDFGLARGEVRPVADSDPEKPSSDLTRGAGTPRYMPPEQAEGKELTPAVDQYALGVSLREALVGRNANGKPAEVPRWLDVIIARATAREASHRYVSMDALVHALSRDPTTIWRRRFIAIGAIGFAGAAFAVGTLRAGGVDKCSGGADEIAKAWNPAVRDSLIAHLTSLGPYGAEEAKRLVPDMTKYGERWAATHQRVCMASSRKELTPQLYDVRLGCLSRAHVALQTVTEILNRADKDRFSNAILAERALPDVERCATETSSSSVEPPPEQIRNEVADLSNEVSKVRYLALAIDPTAKETATKIADRADKLGYLPLIARARLALGFATLGDGGKGAPQAMPELMKSRAAALRSGDLVTFVEAYAREVYARSRSGDQAKTLDVDSTHAMVEDLASGTKSDGVFARTLLLNNLGTYALASGDLAKARTFFQRAIDEPQLGRRDIELNVVTGNLAIVTEDLEQRRKLFREEHDFLERELGPNHQLTLAAWMRGAAQSLDNPVEAAAVLRDACARLAKWHVDVQNRIDTCSYELGWIAEERGDVAETRSAMSAVKGADNKNRNVAAGYLLLADGKVDEAARSMEAYGDSLAKDPAWFNRLVAANAYLVAAVAYQNFGQFDRAIAVLQRSLTIFDDPALNKSASYIKRRIARDKALLAKLLARTQPETAKGLANEALAWYRTAGGYETVIAELEPLTGSH